MLADGNRPLRASGRRPVGHPDRAAGGGSVLERRLPAPVASEPSRRPALVRAGPRGGRGRAFDDSDVDEGDDDREDEPLDVLDDGRRGRRRTGARPEGWRAKRSARRSRARGRGTRRARPRRRGAARLGLTPPRTMPRTPSTRAGTDLSTTRGRRFWFEHATGPVRPARRWLRRGLTPRRRADPYPSPQPRRPVPRRSCFYRGYRSRPPRDAIRRQASHVDGPSRSRPTVVRPQRRQDLEPTRS